MRVLVVEDEEVLSEVFRDFLTELGHQAVLVRSAEAALGQLQTEGPDAIILDIHLPGMSGLDFMQLRGRGGEVIAPGSPEADTSVIRATRRTTLVVTVTSGRLLQVVVGPRQVREAVTR